MSEVRFQKSTYKVMASIINNLLLTRQNNSELKWANYTTSYNHKFTILFLIRFRMMEK